MSGFTKGPWRVHQPPNSLRAHVLAGTSEDATDTYIAAVGVHEPGGTLPNARLLAAAPCLYEVLREIIACDDEHAVFDAFGLADSTDNAGTPYQSQGLADILGRARAALARVAQGGT